MSVQERPNEIVISINDDNNGLFVPITIGNVQVPLLVDTGATVTILSKEYLRKLDPFQELVIEPILLNMVTATGDKRPFYGKCCLDIVLGSQKLTHQFLIADIKQNGILGLDFITKHYVNILPSKNCLTVKGENVQCIRYKDEIEPACTRVSLDEEIVFPPKSEIVSGKIPDPVCMDKMAVELTSQMVLKHQGLVAKAIVDPGMGTVPLKIPNSRDENCRIYKNSSMAQLQVVSQCTDISPQETHLNEGKLNPNTNELPEQLTQLSSSDLNKTEVKDLTVCSQEIEEYLGTCSKSEKDFDSTSLGTDPTTVQKVTGTDLKIDQPIPHKTNVKYLKSVCAENCHVSFDKLQRALTSSPVLT